MSKLKKLQKILRDLEALPESNVGKAQKIAKVKAEIDLECTITPIPASIEALPTPKPRRPRKISEVAK